MSSSYCITVLLKCLILLKQKAKYKFASPSCSSSYIGKTETLYERTKEHAYCNKNSEDQSILSKKISSSPSFSHILDV